MARAGWSEISKSEIKFAFFGDGKTGSKIFCSVGRLHEEAAAFGLQINWSKTKIIQFGNPAPCPTVEVADGLVEVVDSFIYLGSMIDSVWLMAAEAKSFAG